MTDSQDTRWQIGKSFATANKYMLENEIACDTSFVFHLPDGSSQELKAHKYMLVSRSPVFEAMLCGNYMESETSINIVDIEIEVFRELLRFLYCEEVTLNGNNILYVMQAAKKYMLDNLVARCRSFLARELSEENVCTITNTLLAQPDNSDKAFLHKNCLQFICMKTKAVFESEDFLNLTAQSLHAILKMNIFFNVSERQVVASCVRWATRRKKMEESSASIGELLGRCIHEIRFCQMTAQEFARCVQEHPILSDKEENSIFHYIACPEKTPKELAFSTTTRSHWCSIHRYSIAEKDDIRWKCNGVIDAINFCVDRDITFVGTAVYGGHNDGDDYECKVVLYDERTTGEITRQQIKFKSDGSRKEYPVRFTDKHVKLYANVQYSLEVRMYGPRSYFGRGGKTKIKHGHVTFTFSPSKESANGTSVEMGQIPTILFEK